MLLVAAYIVFGGYGFNIYCLIIAVQDMDFWLPAFTCTYPAIFTKCFRVYSPHFYKGKQREPNISNYPQSS